MNYIANAISAIFHPAFLPTLGLVIVLFFSNHVYFDNLNPIIRKAILYVSLIFTLLFPILTVLLFRAFGLVKSVKLETKEERRIPLLLSIVYFLMAYYFIYSKLPMLPSVFYNLPFAGAFLLLLTYLINLKYQISIHMISAGALLATLCIFQVQFGVELSLWISLVIFASGLIATSRLWLHAHTPNQIYLGFSLGFFTQFIVTYWFS